MNELQIFTNEMFGELRTIEENGKMLFCGSDVARALGYSNPRDALLRHCKGVVKHDVGVETGTKADGTAAVQTVAMSFISEGDVYRLITHSKLPAAERFERWVFDEVLPTIRKHGMYAVDELIANPDLGIAALTALKEERAKTKELEAQIEQDKPKVLFANAVEASKSSILIGDLAKLLKQNGVDTGQKRLFDQLRQEGYLMKGGSAYNMPTQRSMEMGLFEVKESTVNNPDGSIRINRTTKVTGKGQTYFINKFLGAVQ